MSLIFKVFDIFAAIKIKMLIVFADVDDINVL